MLLKCTVYPHFLLLLQSAAQLSACSQLRMLSLAQNQLTSLEGLEGMCNPALIST